MTLYPKKYPGKGVWEDLAIGLIVLLGFLLFIESELFLIFISFYALYFIIFRIIPLFYFSHLYYKFSEHYAFTISNNSLEVIYKNKSVIISNDDINKIVIYISASNPRQSIPFSTIDYFHFAQIVLNDGREVVITNLFSEYIKDVLENMDGVRIENEYIFPLLTSREKYKPLFSEQEL